MKNIFFFLCASLLFVASAFSDGGSLTLDGTWNVSVDGGSTSGTITINTQAGTVTYTPTGGSPSSGTVSGGPDSYTISVSGIGDGKDVEVFRKGNDRFWTWQDEGGAGDWGNFKSS